jgi:hypothetical protein
MEDNMNILVDENTQLFGDAMISASMCKVNNDVDGLISLNEVVIKELVILNRALTELKFLNAINGEAKFWTNNMDTRVTAHIISVNYDTKIIFYKVKETSIAGEVFVTHDVLEGTADFEWFRAEYTPVYEDFKL